MINFGSAKPVATELLIIRMSQPFAANRLLIGSWKLVMLLYIYLSEIYVASDQFGQLYLLWRRHKFNAELRCTDEAHMRPKHVFIPAQHHVNSLFWPNSFYRIEQYYRLCILASGFIDQNLLLLFGIAPQQKCSKRALACFNESVTRLRVIVMKLYVH